MNGVNDPRSGGRGWGVRQVNRMPAASSVRSLRLAVTHHLSHSSYSHSSLSSLIPPCHRPFVLRPQLLAYGGMESEEKEVY